MSDPVLPDMVRAEWTWTIGQWRHIMMLVAMAQKSRSGLVTRRMKRLARITQYSSKTPEHLP
jgi:hypothetical protein